MVTSREVARLAGVSQPTVSRALRDDPRVSTQTKRRVRQAAERLGYVPSETGRALSSGRTMRIGLAVTDLENQFYPHVIAPAHRELEANGYQLVLHTQPVDTDAVVERFIAHNLDGVILATQTVHSAIPLRLHDRGMPFVYLNRTSSVVAADAVTVDPDPGLTQAVAAVVEHGHRRVAAVFGPQDTSTAIGRENALRQTLRARGLVLRDGLVQRGGFDTESGYAGTEALLALPDPPTVVFCSNDVVAFGALNAARALGARVPQDVSIIGFDDLPASGWPIIELTTIAFDLDAMVAKAVDLLLRRIENPDRDVEHVVFTSSLVERSTLGPAR